MPEQRQFSRIPFTSVTQLIVGTNHLPAQLQNISLQGALVTIQGSIPLQQGQSCQMEIQLGADIRLKMAAELVRIVDQQLGFRFKSMDVISMTHLRQLITLNMEHPDHINQELSSLTKRA